MLTNFGPRFKALLALRGKSQRWVAQALDKTPMLVSNWVTGVSDPDGQQLAYIRLLLGWTDEVDTQLAVLENLLEV